LADGLGRRFSSTPSLPTTYHDFDILWGRLSGRDGLQQ
jgi:hypothetical protein